MSILAGVLGPLEREIMNVIWESDKCSVWDVVSRLPRKKAYTTVMTTLVRLHQKKFLNRKKHGDHGGKFYYSARLSRPQLEETIARSFITRVLASSTPSREAVLTLLLESIRRNDSKLFGEEVGTIKGKRTSAARRGK
jgi:predicted transcriptional regulator